ncbi:S-adenosyl-L-methionine-dependent methyltransferase [Catenaria anguillulae PL171]|uniref:S-adenosyl-L-methionine-dependent methyltransferase n=1 Tax=Catenaria anguillulae PL171 TaxID=765915 RepID=A0A1Y2HQ82_9FUNG|nr:S-adenosyl-L-methionine-dependent methyltransferase [Catenaria anguillulae PL171]
MNADAASYLAAANGHSSKPDSATTNGAPKLWSASEIVAYYAEFAQSYDTDIEADHRSYPAPFIIGSWILEHLRKFPPEAISDTQSVAGGELRILDLGCGTGQSSRVFFESLKATGGSLEIVHGGSAHVDHAQSKKNGTSDHASSKTVPVKVHGIDATPAMLDRARALPFASLTCANIEQPLPYPVHYFHAIVCVGVMDFIHDPVSLLHQLRNVTADGALLGLTMPEKQSGAGGEDELNGWTRGQMDELIRRGGWWVERHERVLGYVDSQLGKPVWYHAWLMVRKPHVE